MAASQQWWHAEEALPGVRRPAPPAPVPIEWYRQPPSYAPEPEQTPPSAFGYVACAFAFVSALAIVPPAALWIAERI